VRRRKPYKRERGLRPARVKEKKAAARGRRNKLVSAGKGERKCEKKGPPNKV